MKAIVLLALVLLCGCTKADKTRDLLVSLGLTEVKITGYRFFGCDSVKGSDDVFHTGFEAKGPNGVKVSGVVCEGVLKGARCAMTEPLCTEHEMHAPGPWAYNVQTDVPREVRLKREHWEVGSTVTRAGIALVFQGEANACLIAAAPDLLALAKAYASACINCAGHGFTYEAGEAYTEDASNRTRIDCEECAHIREAIAKAEGRS